MAGFLTGLMSVAKKLGGAAKDWGQGTQVGQDIDAARTGKNPWAGGRSRPTLQSSAQGSSAPGSGIGDSSNPIGKQENE